MRTRKITLILMTLLLVIPNAGRAQESEKKLKTIQVSLFPFLGTDGGNALQHRYKYSINLFGGINGGVEGMEMGGFMNINKGNVDGFQMAGFGNFVQGYTKGFQGAGFMNVVNGNFEGLQGAGFMNVVNGTHDGLVGAGFLNVVNGRHSGLTGAGFGNIVKDDYQGMAFAGFMNVSNGNTEGITTAGFMNVTRNNFAGISLAGFANIAGGYTTGIQGAGFMNTAGDLAGIQMSGFLNVAKKVDGIQLGFINIADTITGVPVGFLSIVKKGGLRQWEFAASDVMFANVSYKIGVPLFYNIFSAGWKPFVDNHFGSFGYGVGTHITITERSSVQMELHSSQIYEDAKWFEYDETNLVNELRLNFGYRPAQKFELFAGAVLYNHITKMDQGLQDVSSWEMYENTWDDHQAKWWIGARGGIRFVMR